MFFKNVGKSRNESNWKKNYFNLVKIETFKVSSSYGKQQQIVWVAEEWGRRHPTLVTRNIAGFFSEETSAKICTDQGRVSLMQNQFCSSVVKDQAGKSYNLILEQLLHRKTSLRIVLYFFCSLNVLITKAVFSHEAYLKEMWCQDQVGRDYKI